MYGFNILIAFVEDRGLIYLAFFVKKNEKLRAIFAQSEGSRRAGFLIQPPFKQMSLTEAEQIAIAMAISTAEEKEFQEALRVSAIRDATAADAREADKRRQDAYNEGAESMRTAIRKCIVIREQIAADHKLATDMEYQWSKDAVASWVEWRNRAAERAREESKDDASRVIPEPEIRAEKASRSAAAAARNARTAAGHTRAHAVYITHIAQAAAAYAE